MGATTSHQMTLKMKNIWQYISFATLGTILCWKMAELFTFEVVVIFLFLRTFFVFFSTPLGATPSPQITLKMKNIWQYLLFATLGTVLCWKMAELFTFEVMVKFLFLRMFFIFFSTPLGATPLPLHPK